MAIDTKGSSVLICGAGIIGLTIARELISRGFGTVIVLEKEKQPGMHASGRNSGVLHAGIYYTPDSLRARSCLRGNLLMKEYCRQKNLPLIESGKVIVTRNEEEVGVLRELHRRALANGAGVEIIDEKQLREIEPAAKTSGMALYSRNTAVVDPAAIVSSLMTDLSSSGKTKILTSTEFRGLKGSSTAVTSRGEMHFDHFVNAAGAYSDKVAHSFGVGGCYKIFPFKGIYRKLRDSQASSVRGNIYPVPDLRNPFLGVHLTKNVRGEVYAGPTALPAFGREHYGILKGITRESIGIFTREAILLLQNQEFREAALGEVKKQWPGRFFRETRGLLDGLTAGDLLKSSKVGIRPQLVDWRTRKLVMDFILLRDGNSTHVLNTISPGFTSSMEFAQLVTDSISSSAISAAGPVDNC